MYDVKRYRKNFQGSPGGAAWERVPQRWPDKHMAAKGKDGSGDVALGDRLVLGVPIVASTHLFEDLDFDSFLMIQLVALVEHLADVREPPDELPVVETVGQCYELNLRAVGQSAAGKEEPGALR